MYIECWRCIYQVSRCRYNTDSGTMIGGDMMGMRNLSRERKRTAAKEEEARA